MKHYFYSYTCKNLKFGHTTFCCNIIDSHPIEKIQEANKKYSKDETYTLISFQEISKEEFEQFKGKF